MRITSCMKSNLLPRKSAENVHQHKTLDVETMLGHTADDEDLCRTSPSDLTPERDRFIGLSQGAESTEDSLLDNLGDEYLARRQIRLHLLEQRFKYPTRMISTMMRASGISGEALKQTEWLRKLRARMGEFTFSTSFSGIDTPNIALLLLCAGVDDLDPTDVDGKTTKNTTSL